eukprot:TRINITY_DN33054_c0_g1_i1.p1 TRINITY_DN33054_c0_g1~~TRINITY_DN33054_c0_g1_i1.p1  ORF type:complete len:295 (+),score=30.02 TRINITY_DN33054_c0_g1_i1:73-957(+)
MEPCWRDGLIQVSCRCGGSECGVFTTGFAHNFTGIYLPRHVPAWLGAGPVWEQAGGLRLLGHFIIAPYTDALNGSRKWAFYYLSADDALGPRACPCYLAGRAPLPPSTGWRPNPPFAPPLLSPKALLLHSPCLLFFCPKREVQARREELLVRQVFRRLRLPAQLPETRNWLSCSSDPLLRRRDSIPAPTWISQLQAQRGNVSVIALICSLHSIGFIFLLIFVGIVGSWETGSVETFCQALWQIPKIILPATGLEFLLCVSMIVLFNLIDECVKGAWSSSEQTSYSMLPNFWNSV